LLGAARDVLRLIQSTDPPTKAQSHVHVGPIKRGAWLAIGRRRRKSQAEIIQRQLRWAFSIRFTPKATVLALTVAAVAFDVSPTPGNNPTWRRRRRSTVEALSGVPLLVASVVLTALCTLAQIYREEMQHEAGLPARQR
jgi:hypothetical protein